jgi:hypothetical protein
MLINRDEVFGGLRMQAITSNVASNANLPNESMAEHYTHGSVLSLLQYRSSRVRKGALPRMLLVVSFALAILAYQLESKAAIALVQKATAVNNATNPTATITATFGATPGPNNLLIAIIGTQANVTINLPNGSGWAAAITQNGAPGQAIFYKNAGAAEPTGVTITVAAATALGLQIYEYSGTAITSPLDGVAAFATGNGTAVFSGTVIPSNTNDLLIAGLVINIQNATFSLQTNSFVEQADISNLGSPQMSYAGEDRLSSSGNNSTTATSSKTGPWRGQIAAFKSLTPTACKLESFTASRSEDGVVLEWRTGFEVDNIGFNIYKEDQSGKLARLTPHLVAGSGLMVRRGTALTAGFSYSWSDPDVKNSDSARYWLEDLDVSGQSTWNGPYAINETSRSVKSRSAASVGRSMMINALNTQQREQVGQNEASKPVESKAKIATVTVQGLALQTNFAGKPAVKISVRQEGWYRVSQAQLLTAGLSSTVDPRKLQLSVDGNQIPIIVRGEQDGTLDAADSIEFYGIGLDTSSTDTRVYWLVAGTEPGLRFTQSSNPGSGGGSFPHTIQLKERLYYFSNVKNGETDNFFGAFIYNQPTNQALLVSHIAPGADATLEISMQGFSQVPHQIGVSLNGSPVGTLNFDNQTLNAFQLTVPQGLLLEGTNTVSLLAQASADDFSFVDYIRLTYAHSYAADNNLLRFTANGGQGVTLGGFANSSVRVVDITDPASYQEVLGNVSPDAQGYSIGITAPAGGTRTLLAFTDAQVRQAGSVTANRPSTWINRAKGADFVIFSTGDFSSSLQPLKSLRQSQGLATEIVDIEDVYDEFSYGQKTPQAVKDFLSNARNTWKKAPKYVLLGGTASFDPRNYLAVGETDFVPTKFLETDRLETASDDWFGDFNNDGVPEIAVGRLPARSVDEVEIMVHKIMSYEQGAKGNGVLLVADTNDGFNFESSNDRLRALVPAGTPVQEIRRGSDPSAGQHLVDALNDGKKVVNYNGHGSIDLWRANLLTSGGAATLTNSQKLSIVVAMTCLNGYFVDERIESLAHALLSAREGGAVAMWSSSGMTNPDGQALADQELFRQIFNGTSARLGDATIKAKTAVSDIDVRRTWILIGDPTTRLQ